MLKSFMKYYVPYKKALALLLLGSLIRAIMELIFPYVVRQMLELELPKADLQKLLVWCSGLLALYVGQFCLQYLISYFGLSVSAAIENDMRLALFQRLQQMSFSYFDKNKSGNLISRLTSDLTELGDLAARGPCDITVCSLQIVGTMIILIYMNPWLGCLVVFLLLLKMLHMAYMNLQMGKSFLAVRVAMGDLTARASESMNGIRLVKAFATESRDKELFQAEAQAYIGARKSSFRIRSYFIGSMIFFSNFINVAILVGGGILIHKGQLHFSDVVAYFLYVGMFMKPLMQLIGFSESYQRGMAGYKRFYEVMQEKPEILDAPNAIPLAKCEGRITFDRVSFGYEKNTKVLDDFSLVVEPGETVAFVGATGAGKSTIANLLLRFYEPQKGSIRIDGVDIDKYQQESLRRQIGLVQQEVFLFGDSVKANIAYGRLDALDEEIKAAARAAAAEGFIRQLPGGYATEIGERGVKLSGGQRQRLAIARVFLKNPPILVLDEATSALDNKTEKQVQQALDKLATGRTTLIIAHRLSTVMNADRIVVLKEGKAVEIGSHEELLRLKGVYYDLYEAQLQ